MPGLLSPAHVVLTLVTLALTAGMILAWSWAIFRLSRNLPLLECRGPRIVPWRAGEVLMVILLYVGVNIGATVAYGVAVGGKGSSMRALLVVMALANLLQLVLFPLVLRLMSGARLADFGLVRGAVGLDFVRGGVACLLVTPVVYGVMSLLTRVWGHNTHPMEDMIRANPTGSIALIAFVSGVVLAPAAEELLFRGILQGWLERACSGLGRKPRAFADEVDLLVDGPVEPAPIVVEEFAVSSQGVERTAWSAPTASPLTPARLFVTDPQSRRGGFMRILPNLVTSTLFAALHFAQWPAPIPLFLLSLAMGELYRRTGGLVAPFALHASFNGLSTAMLYLALMAGVKPPAKAPEAPAPVPPAATAPEASQPSKN